MIVLRIVDARDRRKPLQLLHRESSMSAIQLEGQSTMWLPRYFPVRFKPQSPSNGGGGKKEIKVAAL